MEEKSERTLNVTARRGQRRRGQDRGEAGRIWEGNMSTRKRIRVTKGSWSSGEEKKGDQEENGEVRRTKEGSEICKRQREEKGRKKKRNVEVQRKKWKEKKWVRRRGTRECKMKKEKKRKEEKVKGTREKT